MSDSKSFFFFKVERLIFFFGIVYDFHKINENNTDEDVNTNEIQTQRWDFKHPWFNKAGFDRLHKIRRKPPRNRLIPQIRYSSAMEILPSNSPDYEADPCMATESSPVSDSATANNQLNPGVQDAISQLQGTAGHLESKLDFTANEVQYLRKVTENQQEVILSTFKRRNDHVLIHYDRS